MPLDRHAHIKTSDAPGEPGTAARWTSSAKSGVGTSLSPASRVWFTISHGILNEIYYPRVDLAATRDLGLLVADGHGYLSEEKRDTQSEVSALAEGVPGYRIVNTCEQGRYRIEKQIVTDPQREVLLQHVRFTPLQGSLQDYRLYALLAPHLYNSGAGNNAWVGEYKGLALLLAERQGFALALACSSGWRRRSAGFVGVSDGWTDLTQNRQMLWEYRQAENGNTALTGEVALEDSEAEFVLALGFGSNSVEAGNRARASLQDGFERARDLYVGEWQRWQQRCQPLETPSEQHRRLLSISTAVLKTHEEKSFPGGIIASLSVPWGFSRGDDDLGGYHLAWPRDQVQAAGGLLATGAQDDVRRVLHYLQSTQEGDGHWPQNMWLDGWVYWQGIQLDETALPVLLVEQACREGAADEAELRRLWPMVRAAAGFIVRQGPVTEQDRWEENGGHSPYTLAVAIAALLAAAALADQVGEAALAPHLRETADYWNANLDDWLYFRDTEFARAAGVEGHYVRITPAAVVEARDAGDVTVTIRNRPPGEDTAPAALTVSTDFLALVRYGLRRADDPRILNTLKVVDAHLRVETPQGPAWRRYNRDGYGEHEDGSPYDGTGRGRLWPLLTGERAHYALAAGDHEQARELLDTMAAFANEGGMIPEQVWDGEPQPRRDLFPGRPSGSAMPLVWAHAEYLKLLRSLRDGKVFDQPPGVVQRYLAEQHGSTIDIWRFNHPVRRLRQGRTLRVETLAPAAVHYTTDGWGSATDRETRDTGLGVHVVDLDTGGLGAGTVISLTFYWPQAKRWEGRDFSLKVEAPPPA